jgi:hypothetical protein
MEERGDPIDGLCDLRTEFRHCGRLPQITSSQRTYKPHAFLRTAIPCSEPANCIGMQSNPKFIGRSNAALEQTGDEWICGVADALCWTGAVDDARCWQLAPDTAT